MERRGNAYTIGFAALICVFCSVVVAGTSVLLRDRQERNKHLERQRNVLAVTGIESSPQKISPDKVQSYFQDDPSIETAYFIKKTFINLKTGEQVKEDEVQTPYNMYRAARKPKSSRKVKSSLAKKAQIKRVPQYGTVYLVRKRRKEDLQQIVIQIWGQGLWETMYGYLALEADGKTIKGITFYEHGETPGLGGEVDNPSWKKQWVGRKAYDKEGNPALTMRKGGAEPPKKDPHGFDVLSGATITSRAVENMTNFWLGPEGYGPFLKKFLKTD